MTSLRPVQLDELTPKMVAPCGLNCAVCSRAFRVEDRCEGCRRDGIKPKYCETCRIRNCPEVTTGTVRFCSECGSYPCPRLRRLDQRYRTRYHVSLLENLDNIRDMGIEEFVRAEKARWTCEECGAVRCIHKEHCLVCGHIGPDTTETDSQLRASRLL